MGEAHPDPGEPRGAGPTPLVELSGIRKAYGDLVVNDGVDLAVTAGQVHALLGENGAGKTTLMRILYGLTRPDAGAIEVDGRPVRIGSPSDAIDVGIGMVTQHFSLVGPMTVTENVMLTEAGVGRVDRRAARRRVVEAAERIGVSVDPDARVDRLSVGEQQRVEVLKALAKDCRVLILDEPTAVLIPQDVQALFGAIRRLTAQGMGVLFISHKLGEVVEISDQVSVLRKGVITGSVPAAGTDPKSLAEMMVGRPTVGVRRANAPDLDDADLDLAAVVDQGTSPGAVDVPAGDPPAAPTQVRPPALRITDLRLAGTGLRRRAVLDGIDLTVRPGEIVGMAGVSGNGQTELVRLLCGLLAPTAGRVEVAGTEVTGASPRRMMAAGLGCITEDRHASVVPAMTVEQNLILHRAREFRSGLLLNRTAVRRHAVELIERFSIKAQPTDPIGSLSGGNMQKVLLARTFATDPAALVASQPTRGLDVGAAEFVQTQLLHRRSAGGGILLISEDLEELLALSDRIVVIYAGRIVGDLPVQRADPETLGLLMSGQSADEVA